MSLESVVNAIADGNTHYFREIQEKTSMPIHKLQFALLFLAKFSFITYDFKTGAVRTDALFRKFLQSPVRRRET